MTSEVLLEQNGDPHLFSWRGLLEVQALKGSQEFHFRQVKVEIPICIEWRNQLRSQICNSGETPVLELKDCNY